MSRDELIRRINEALDSAEGLEGDLALQRIFARDPAASDLADEIARIDRALRSWPQPARSEEAWDALAETIEQRLDDALPPMKDPTSRPMLEEDEDRERAAALEGTDENDAKPARVSRASPPMATASGEFSLKLLTKMAGGTADEEQRTDGDWDRFSFTDLAPPPPRVASSAPAPFIDPTVPPPAKSERSAARGAMSWVGGALAAAAVVSLGVVIGMSLSGGDQADELALREEAPSAVTQAAPAAEYEPGRYDGVFGGAEEPAVAEAELAEEERAADEAVGPVAALQRAESGEWDTPERSARMRRAPSEPPASQLATRAQPSRTPMAEERAGGGAGGASRETGVDAPTTEQGAGASPSGSGGTATAETPVREQAVPEEPPRPANLPETPDRDSVIAAMRSVQPLVSACAQERHGVATVEITVGSSGRVRSALVTGDFAGTPEGSCVARAVRRARFPEFTRPTFEITYPFSL